MNPYISEFQKETLLLRIPSRLFVQSVQAFFDESTRHVMCLIIAELDTMKIVKKTQTIVHVGFLDWTFSKHIRVCSLDNLNDHHKNKHSTSNRITLCQYRMRRNIMLISSFDDAHKEQRNSCFLQHEEKLFVIGVSN